MTYFATTQDPFQPYDSAKKPKPGVPEPAAYGMILMIFILMLAMWQRRRR